MEDTLKKGYGGFILWIILFTAGVTGISFLPVVTGSEDVDLMIRIIDCVTMISLDLLLLMIYRNEKVFWFTGITYEQALAAGSARRKSYAAFHLRAMGILTAVIIPLSIVGQILHFSWVVDFVGFVGGLLIYSIFAMFRKL